MSNTNDFIIENGVLKKYVGPGGDVVIPAGVLEIGENAFMSRDKLSKVFIPKGVKIIGESAFQECISLAEVTLPDGLEIIGDGAFFFTPIKSINIPESVTDIGNYAFCLTHLRTVVIPQRVKTIGTRAFNNINGVINTGTLTDVTILSSEVTIGGKAFPEGFQVRIYAPNAPLSLFSAECKRQIIFTYLTSESEYPPERVEEYNKYIDKTDDLIGLLIERRKTVALSKLLQIKSKVKLEKLDAFIEQAKGIFEIEAALLEFKGKLFNPSDIEIIEERKAEIALGIKTQTVAEWKKLFRFEKGEKGLVITAYKGEDEIVEVPEMIGKDTVIAIGERAFSSFANRAKNRDARGNIKQVILPNTVEEIGKCAFQYCGKLWSIVLPNSVMKIGDRAFDGCSRLASIVIPENVTKIDRIFTDCTSLSSVVISDGVKEIGSVTFSGCTNLSNITIPNSVEYIDFGAFYRCPNVKIKAPAGSYAEQYAKENNIPFVAEG